jgi:hypothetical protein
MDYIDPTISEFATRRPWPFEVTTEDVLRVAKLIGLRPVEGRVPRRYVHVLGFQVEQDARQRGLIASRGRAWIAQMDDPHMVSDI